MKIPRRWSTSTLIFGGCALWSLLLISCMTTDRIVVVPGTGVPGATYVGTKECVQCHSDQTDHFAGSTHARLKLAGAKIGDTGCEACHGPGSIHVASGGKAGTIINPGKSPEACFQCHLDKRGEFSLPHTHPVIAGKVSCVDCHDVHRGNAIKGGGAALATQTQTCPGVPHRQAGPFVYPHGAIREEGCTACHKPGTVRQRQDAARPPTPTSASAATSPN